MTSSISAGRDAIHVKFSGAIVEDANFTSIDDRLGSSMIFDLSGITRINSVGVKIWIHFISSLSRTVSIVFTRCSPPFVQQLNTIRDFAGKADVRSVLLPYVCEACGDECFEEFELANSDTAFATMISCKTCGSEAEFDSEPEEYLTFTRRG